MLDHVVIGTRGSALALWQAEHVADRLRAAQEGLKVSLKVIKTKGDKIQDVPLAKVGGKGLFVKEIEQAMTAGAVDIAVHSIKDVPAELAEGLVLVAIPERADPRDALVSRSGGGLESLPQGAVVGTSSLRRCCQLSHRRPDLELRDLRGNVDTRLRKLDEGQYDAVVLAAAGLKRLGLGDRISEVLDPSVMLPAVGQGALGIEIRKSDWQARQLVRGALHHVPTNLRVSAERAMLAKLGGGCQVPVAGYAVLDEDGELHLEGLVGHPSGQPMYRCQQSSAGRTPAELGQALAEELLGLGADAVLKEVYE